MTPPGRGRGRSAAPVAVTLGVLVGGALALWGLDRLAEVAAESLLAEEVQEVTGTVAHPAVEVGGGSALVQALRGRYDLVEVALPQVSNGPLTLERVDAELRDVHLSFSDLLVRDADAVVVEAATTEARLDYDALERWLGFTGRRLTVAPAGPDEVQLAGAGQVLDRSYEATAAATVDDADGALVVRPTDLRTQPVLDGVAELLVDQRFRFRVPLDPLPFGPEVTGIDVGEDAVTVRTEGTGVVLRT